MLKGVIKNFFSLLGLQISKADKTGGRLKISFSPDEVYHLKWLKDYKFETIIDIGANEGQFAAKIGFVFPAAEIHCFEPLPQVFEKLRDNFKDNKKVVVYNFGLGEANEEKLIHNNEFSPSSSLLEMSDLHKSNFDFAVRTEDIRIKIRRLDDVFENPPRGPLLLKIDVQGYEMNVLLGAEKTILLADIVVVETSFVPLYKGQPLFADIYRFFDARGFQYAGNIDQLISPKDHHVLHADAIFIKKGLSK